MTKLLGQLQDAGNTTTLSHYLELLDSAGLLTGLEKYAPDVARQKMSIPKWQVQNSAFQAFIIHTVLRNVSKIQIFGDDALKLPLAFI